MERLGYYAKDAHNNLFRFEWKANDDFWVLMGSTWKKQDPKDYEILEIGFFTAPALLPDELKREYSRWIQSYANPAITIEQSNRYFANSQLRKLKELAKKYNIPLEILRKYYEFD